MSLRLDATSRRFAFAVVISLIVHGLVLWGPGIRLPHPEFTLPPLEAKLEALPVIAAKHKTRRVARPEVQKYAPVSSTQTESPHQDTQPAVGTPVAASEPVAASAPVATQTLATDTETAADRPLLPKRARLTFAVSTGTGRFRVGEAVHTLEIENGHYVLHAVTQTVGLVKLFKSYKLVQDSSGSYGKHGLQPDLFSEERIERPDTQRIAVQFDHAAQRARFSNGKEVTLAPDTQDILSIMYQFPPLTNTEKATVSVSNGRKIEHYEFRIVTDEEIDTAVGKLLTVRLSKLHGPDEEGLEIWLAREYRMFPVKMRFIDKNGEVTGEAVITDIRVSEEQGARSDAVN